MSFLFELDAPGCTAEMAEQLERATEETGYLPVRAAHRERWRRRGQTGLSLWPERDGIHVLSDAADWSEDAFTFDERGREMLARTISLLADALQPGWALRAYWDGDPCQEERSVTRDELVELVLRSALK